MRKRMNGILGSRLVPVCALASMAFLVACSGSDDKSVAGGASGDAGVVAVKDLDVAGLTQKGPFVKGSAVTVQGIDCKTLEISDEYFEGQVNSDKGDFALDNVTLSSSCALFEVTGKYRNEVTGKKSAGEITLHALTDLKDRKNVNINVLTELEYERLMYLVTEKDKKFEEAKAQAEKEVLAAFGIAGDFDNSEDLNIFGPGDGNAALLAVSVMMQGDADVAALAKRIERFEDSFAESGEWNDAETKKAIAEWIVATVVGDGLENIRKNLEGLGIADTIPAFEKYIVAAIPDSVLETRSSSSKDVDSAETSSSSSADVVPGSSGEAPSSSSSVTSSSSKGPSSSSAKADAGSRYDATANTLKDLRDGKTYRTTNIGGRVWMAENLNYETPNSYCYNDSAEYCETYGRLYTIAAAVDSIGAFGSAGKGCGLGVKCSLEGTVRGACPSGWHLPDADEWKALFITAGADVKSENPLRPDMNVHQTFKVADKLMSKSGWGHVSYIMGDLKNIGTDDFGFSVLPAGYRVGALAMVLDGGTPYYMEPGNTAGFLYVYERPGDSTFYGWTYNYATMIAYISFDAEDYDVEIYDNNKDNAYSVRCVKDGGLVMPNSSSSVASSSSISSSSSSGSFDWSLPKETYLNPNIEYDSIVDSRDGKVYKTVKIGDQTWMAENLNYDPGQGGSDDAKYDWSWCFNNEPKNCDVAGRLYTWAAAIDSVKLANDAENPRNCGDGKACYLSSTVQGICDKGWHLPTRMEWKALFTAVGNQSTAGVVLKSQVGWYNDGNGTDAFGFSALPAGYSIDKDHFYDAGLFADFWSSTEYASKYAYDMYMKYNFEDALVVDFNKSYGYSVRCVKD
ncbi:fibrobacter succinogenes major paralogous domain-containing protein [Fibrobacter sp.]|uniref:fibrobacter succinogenes major paralogous domain-containing protein n=1 Tax=Fibrobacter sp. TaxID=35828 RepID=UPI00388EA009